MHSALPSAQFGYVKHIVQCEKHRKTSASIYQLPECCTALLKLKVQHYDAFVTHFVKICSL